MSLGSVSKTFLFKWKIPARNMNNNILWKFPANRKARNHEGKRNKSNNTGKKECFLPKLTVNNAHYIALLSAVTEE